MLSIVVCLLVLFFLDWLLGWVIWLPLYSGLFGFLVAGLIAGGATFRIARPLRPLARRQVMTLAIAVATLNAGVALYWEYAHVADSVAELKNFAGLRRQASIDGRPRDEIPGRIRSAFREKLRRDHPPGGPIGYAYWCIQKGEMAIEVDGAKDIVYVPHSGWLWLIRTGIAYLLMAVGLWFSFDALRSPEPIRNVLRPDEPYEEIE